MNSISFNTISRSIKRKVKGGEKQARRRGKKERQEGRKRVASQIKASLRAALRYLSQTLFTFFLCHRPNDNLCQQRALKGHCKASFFFFFFASEGPALVYPNFLASFSPPSRLFDGSALLTPFVKFLHHHAVFLWLLSKEVQILLALGRGASSKFSTSPLFTLPQSRGSTCFPHLLLRTLQNPLACLLVVNHLFLVNACY